MILFWVIVITLKNTKFWVYATASYVFRLFVLLTIASCLPILGVKTTPSCVGSEAACVLVFSATPLLIGTAWCSQPTVPCWKYWERVWPGGKSSKKVYRGVRQRWVCSIHYRLKASLKYVVKSAYFFSTPAKADEGYLGAPWSRMSGKKSATGCFIAPPHTTQGAGKLWTPLHHHAVHCTCIHVKTI